MLAPLTWIGCKQPQALATAARGGVSGLKGAPKVPVGQLQGRSAAVMHSVPWQTP